MWLHQVAEGDTAVREESCPGEIPNVHASEDPHGSRGATAMMVLPAGRQLPQMTLKINHDVMLCNQKPSSLLPGAVCTCRTRVRTQSLSDGLAMGRRFALW